MDADEPEHAAQGSKREPKPTAKAVALKIETLQKDRKAKVNQMKHMILSMKDLLKYDGNAPEVCSMLGSLKCLKDDASVLHKEVLPFLPPAEQDKQNEWFYLVCKHNDGFVEDVERWLNETKNLSQTVQTTDANSSQSHVNLCSPLSVTPDPRAMEDLAEPQLSCASNIPSSAEAVSSSQNMHLSSEYHNLEANYNDVENQIQPTDSVSNVSRKSSKTSSRITTTHGSHSSRSSIASARLKIEAEMAALQAHQKMLQRKHALQKEEEDLRRRKEQMELDTKIAVSMAKMKVYSDVRSEISEIINPFQTNAPQIMNTRTKSLNPNVESFLPSSSYAVSQHPPASSIQTQVVAENSKHFPTRTVQQPIVRSKSRSTHSALPPSIGHDGRQERGSRLQDAHGSCLQDDLDEGNILKLIDKQNDIAALLVQQNNLSSLPPREVPFFDGDPLRYHDFMHTFEEVVEKKSSGYADSLHFLEQYTRGQPKELVRSCQHMIPSQGYIRAKDLLKEHFGNEVRIASAYMEKALSWKMIKSEDAKALQDYGLFLRSCCNAMQNIRYMNELNLATNMQAILAKLPYKLRERWRIVAYDLQERRNDQAYFSDIVYFIERQVKIIMDPVFGNIQDVLPSGGRNLNTRLPHPKSRSSFATTVTATSGGQECSKKLVNKICLFCEGEHALDSCNKLAGKSHGEKMSFLKKKGICFGCLCTGHISRDCKERSICKICQLKHPSLLHIFSQDRKGSQYGRDTEFKPAVGSALVSIQSSGLTGAGRDNCALSIVPVCVKSKKGSKVVTTYAFLDSGSSASFCTESLMTKLNLPAKKVNILMRTMNQDKSISCHVLNDLEVSGLNQEHFCSLPEVYTQKTMPVDKSNIATQNYLACWPHLSHICLPSIDAGVELLIGSNVPEALEPWQIIRSQNNGPYTIKTLFGWAVNGPIKRLEEYVVENHPHMTVNRITVVKLNELWEQQFKADFPECVQEEQMGMSKEDHQFMDFVSHSAKLINGHYHIGLPLRNEKVAMPNNRAIVEQRALNLQRKFRRNAAFHADYTTFMENVISKGHAEKVPIAELERLDGRLWYIPHHGVYHPKKQKIRVVFDCGASYQGTSLNEHLLQGPDLTSPLMSVLVRFRMEYVAVMADIESMFHQVKVYPDDCDLLRFLWWPGGDIDCSLEEHRMLVHLFGATSSPSCSSYALRKCAEDHKDLYDAMTVDVVYNNFYVDNCLVSVPTDSDAVLLYQRLTKMCIRGGFRLTKWISNSRTVLNAIPEEDR